MNTPCGSFHATESRANIFHHRFPPPFHQPRTSRVTQGQPSGSPPPQGARLGHPPLISTELRSSSDSATNMVEASMEITPNPPNGGATSGERPVPLQAAEDFPQEAPYTPTPSVVDSIPVFVMLPLDTINADGVFKYASSRWFLAGMQQLKDSGIHGVAVDVWVSSA